MVSLVDTIPAAANISVAQKRRCTQVTWTLYFNSENILQYTSMIYKYAVCTIYYVLCMVTNLFMITDATEQAPVTLKYIFIF